MAKKPTNHLLVIRLSAMGDVAISVPVLMALTQQYPELRLTICSAFCSPAQYRGLPYRS